MDGNFFKKDGIHLNFKGNNKLMELITKSVKYVPTLAFTDAQKTILNLSDSVDFPKLSLKRPAPRENCEKFPRFPTKSKTFRKLSFGRNPSSHLFPVHHDLLDPDACVHPADPPHHNSGVYHAVSLHHNPCVHPAVPLHHDAGVHTAVTHHPDARDHPAVPPHHDAGPAGVHPAVSLHHHPLPFTGIPVTFNSVKHPFTRDPTPFTDGACQDIPPPFASKSVITTSTAALSRSTDISDAPPDLDSVHSTDSHSTSAVRQAEHQVIQSDISQPVSLGCLPDQPDLSLLQASHSHHPPNCTSKKFGPLDTSKRSGFTLIEISGDLFDREIPGSFCQSVSQDLALKKGIATQFKTRFKNLSSIKMKEIARLKGVGGVAVLEENGRFLYNLVTKEHYFQYPVKLQNLEKSIRKMRNHARAHNIRRINMPRISCGLDRLKWFDVRRMLRKYFKNEYISIVVYNLANVEDDLKGEDRATETVQIEQANFKSWHNNQKVEDGLKQLNNLETEVTKLKSSIETLISERREDKILIDDLERHIEKVDEGADTLISIVEEKITSVENKLTKAHCQV